MLRKIKKSDKRAKISEQAKNKPMQSSDIVYECELCDLKSNSLFQLKEHLKGKKHKMLSAESSVTSVVRENASTASAPYYYNSKRVGIAFVFLGISVMNFLYVFFLLVDAKHNRHLFYV